MRPPSAPRLANERELREAEWVSQSIVPGARGGRKPSSTLAMIIPNQSEAYARIFNPAGFQRYREWHPVDWARIALASGKAAHALMQFRSITWRDSWPGLWTYPPGTGYLDPSVLTRVCDTLAAYTPPDSPVWSLHWEGYSSPTSPLSEHVATAGRISVLGLNFYLAIGTLADIKSASLNLFPWPMNKRPGFWWPEDRSWCVVSEVDFDSTYVGGRRECIDALLEAPIESAPVSLTDGYDYLSDLLNGPPTWR